jgi:glycosyltransferase involved in cell wall biosynthesis
VSTPRVVLLRGHNANPWDLRPWELLLRDYEVEVLVSGSNRFALEDLHVPARPIRTVRDRAPRGRLGDLAALAVGDGYRGLEEALAGADIVHAAELGNPFSGGPARLRDRLGYRLVLTVWETIPFRDAFRGFRGRRDRRDVLAAADLYLAATDRARRCLLLEGADPGRIQVSPPGVDTARFASREPPAEHLVVSPGRLVWEKGHYDLLRAVATLEEPPRVLLVGSGPERERLLRYADELGLDRVECRAVPYAEMPEVFGRASCVVLGSLAVPLWEEQFGMVLAEAMAAGVPVLASASGAIPEVLGGQGQLFRPGDWPELARLLREQVLAAPPRREGYDVSAYTLEAAAGRLRAAYERVLAR